MTHRLPCLLILILSATAAAAEPAALPNVVLCMADDQGYGDVGYYGNPVLKTPVLDEMAATALRLDRFYAAAPVCSPTRGSVMTGRHPNRFGCFSWGHTLRPQEVTVAEAMKTAGYTTGHFGKWHLGPVRAESSVCPGASGFDEWFSSPNFFENDPLMSRRGKVVRTRGESSQVTVDAAIEFIRATVKQKQPFLAVVWFGSPHGPHIALDEDRRQYADQPEKLQHFYGEITAMDRAIGNLRAELRRLDVAENTLFWYTSDNGALPVGSTAGLTGRKGNLGEGGIREPAIIEWPARIKRPRTSDMPCGTVDIYPTLLDIAGVTVAKQPVLDGVSLLPLIEGRKQQRDKPLGFWVHPTRGISTRSTAILQQMLAEQEGSADKVPAKSTFREPGKIEKQYPEDKLPGPAAWIDGNYKLHRKAGKRGDATYSLFDLAADRQEQTDLAAEQPERLERMKAQLRAWQQSVVRSLNGEDYAPVGQGEP
ncbi:MAG: sulfatase-like hydrolase/transferase [Candidatus Nealsonbacteria bacterium]|nr:sulfatase-like hydrolase/transferase [Candidatus Nealsonbacteria bacterium]